MAYQRHDRLLSEIAVSQQLQGERINRLENKLDALERDLTGADQMTKFVTLPTVGPPDGLRIFDRRSTSPFCSLGRRRRPSSRDLPSISTSDSSSGDSLASEFRGGSCDFGGDSLNGLDAMDRLGSGLY